MQSFSIQAQLYPEMHSHQLNYIINIWTPANPVACVILVNFLNIFISGMEKKDWFTSAIKANLSDEECIRRNEKWVDSQQHTQLWIVFWDDETHCRGQAFYFCSRLKVLSYISSCHICEGYRTFDQWVMVSLIACVKIVNHSNFFTSRSQWLNGKKILFSYAIKAKML